VGAAVDRVDVVGEEERDLVLAVEVLERHLDVDAVDLALGVDRLGMHHLPILVQVAYE